LRRWEMPIDTVNGLQKQVNVFYGVHPLCGWEDSPIGTVNGSKKAVDVVSVILCLGTVSFIIQ